MKTPMEQVNKAHAKLVKATESERGALASYGIAWMLGVPISLLVIIYLLVGR